MGIGLTKTGPEDEEDSDDGQPSQVTLKHAASSTEKTQKKASPFEIASSSDGVTGGESEGSSSRVSGAGTNAAD